MTGEAVTLSGNARLCCKARSSGDIIQAGVTSEPPSLPLEPRLLTEHGWLESITIFGTRSQLKATLESKWFSCKGCFSVELLLRVLSSEMRREVSEDEAVSLFSRFSTALSQSEFGTLQWDSRLSAELRR